MHSCSPLSLSLSLYPCASLSSYPCASLSSNPCASLSSCPRASLSSNPCASLSSNPCASLSPYPCATPSYSLTLILLAFSLGSSHSVVLGCTPKLMWMDMKCRTTMKLVGTRTRTHTRTHTAHVYTHRSACSAAYRLCTYVMDI